MKAAALKSPPVSDPLLRRGLINSSAAVAPSPVGGALSSQVPGGAVQSSEKNRLGAWIGIYAELFKARLTLLVLLSMLVGFYMGAQGPLEGWLMWHALLGTALVAGGAAALNQYLERDLDARMRRTQDRPLPSGQLTPRTVLLFGWGAALAGLVWLALRVNLLTAALGALSLLSYLFIYTPLKQRTWLNTVVGTIPGALPPLMGWAAARGELGLEGLVLFGIQAFWQVPHFLAIAWMYRADYAQAGFKMLPAFDPAGKRTSRQALGFALGLLLVSLCPFLLGTGGSVYLGGALMLGLLFAGLAAQFRRRVSTASARRLFFASLLYLPLLLGLLVWDKVK